MSTRTAGVVLALSLSLPLVLGAQNPPPAYGKSLGLEQARKVAAAAIGEAVKNDWDVIVAVVDAGGNLVLLERMDDAQFGSIEVAQQKAWSAVAFRRPTKAFEDSVAEGGAGLRVLRVPGASPVEGGLPLLSDGKIVGAIGVSGVKPSEDGQIARAGANAMR